MRQVRENLEYQNFLLLQNPIACNSQQRWGELLEKIAQGDQSAFGSLYKDTSSLLFGLILRIVADRSLAEEVLLELFKQVWRQAALFDTRGEKPLAWILTMARTLALDYLRSGKCENHYKKPVSQEFLFSIPHTKPEQASLISQQQKLARAALLTLPATEREVIELTYYFGLTPREIALRLKLPLDVVKNHLRLAMMKLREFLNPVLQEQL